VDWWIAEDSIQLRGVDVQIAFGPDQVVGFGDLFFNGLLGADALLDLFGGPTTVQETLALGSGGTGDANRGVHFRFGIGFKEKRDDDNGKGPAFGAPGFDLFAPEGADAGVQDVFEFFAGGGVGKNAAGNLVAAEPAVGIQHVRAEQSLNFSERGLAGFDDFASQQIRVHHGDAAFEQQVVSGGLAHADAAG